jgi:hypothetical protein
MTTGKTSLLVQIAGHRLQRQLCRVYSIGDKNDKFMYYQAS